MANVASDCKERRRWPRCSIHRSALKTITGFASGWFAVRFAPLRLSEADRLQMAGHHQPNDCWRSMTLRTWHRTRIALDTERAPRLLKRARDPNYNDSRRYLVPPSVSDAIPTSDD